MAIAMSATPARDRGDVRASVNVSVTRSPSSLEARGKPHPNSGMA
jgi:hypothetical protein